MVFDSDKPTIGISECITDSLVRYDGKSEFNPQLIASLSGSFNLQTVCPEVECGFGVPRPPIELVDISGELKVLGRDDKNLDVSKQLKEYANQKALTLGHLSGYIFKARSPSCGLNSAPIYSLEKEKLRLSNGIFAAALVQAFPLMPVIESEKLVEERECIIFIDRVNKYISSKIR